MKTNRNTIYLDYAAATPLDPELASVMQHFETELFYNPSAPYSAAREVKAALNDARTRIAACIGSKPGSIVFTAGATEATNLAFSSLASDAHVVVSAIEHDSVLACAEPFEHSLVAVDGRGLISIDALTEAITSKTELVSVALANGEVGSVQPLRHIAQVVAQERMRRLAAGNLRPIYLHTDASQAASYLSLNVSTLGVDMMTLSAAKIYGPKQVGLLWAQEGIALQPIVRGGGQESGLRSGTENVPGIIGFARALELACEKRNGESQRLEGIRSTFLSTLKEDFPEVEILGPRRSKLRLPSIVSLSFSGLLARRLVIELDARGVLVGTGSACAASKMRVSHVLLAMGLSEAEAEGTLRISFGRHSTEDEAICAAHTIAQVAHSEHERLCGHTSEVRRAL